MPPTIRTTFDANGNITAIETFQGPLGWVHILSEPIQRGDVPDLAAAIRERSILDGSSPTPDEARRLVEAHRIAAADVARCGALHASGPGTEELQAECDAEAALLRALGVEAC